MLSEVGEGGLAAANNIKRNRPVFLLEFPRCLVHFCLNPNTMFYKFQFFTVNCFLFVFQRDQVTSPEHSYSNMNDLAGFHICSAFRVTTSTYTEPKLTLTAYTVRGMGDTLTYVGAIHIRMTNI